MSQNNSALIESKIDEAVVFLSKNDEVIHSIIRKHGRCHIRLKENYFESLVHSIVSQQLSTRAARAILNRLKQLTNNHLSPDVVESIDVSEFRKIGMSGPKALYIRNLSAHFRNNSFDAFTSMSNDEVIETLTAIKGIGLWTAQMFLIFSLGRLNVLPVSDVGFKRSIMINYNLEEKPSEEQITRLAEKWGAYPAIAAWYLWKAIDD